MLAIFRAFANTLVGKVLVGLLMIGMAGFGISNVITGLGSTTLATVGGDEISVRDFQRAYNDQLNAVSQQIGKSLNSQEAMAYGIPMNALQQIASNDALSKFGSNLGLGVSDDKMGEMVRNDPTFSSALGAFDADTFKRALQQSGYTEAEYFKLQADAARRQQLATGLFGGTVVPATAIDILNHFTADTRTIDYVVLNADTVTSVADPTDDDLAAYLKAHQADYRTKETRTVDIVVLSPETLAAAKTVPEDQIAAEYDKTKDSLVKAEKRTIQQVALTTPELLKAFEDGKTANTPIADLLTATKATPDDMGTLAKADISDSSLAEAAFSLPKDGYAIIDGIGSKRAIIVTDIQGGGHTTLAEAHDDIAKRLALKAARDEYGDILDQAEELRAANKPVTEIQTRLGIKLSTLGVTAGGPELVGVEAIPDDQRGKVAEAIFDAEQGDVPPSITLGSNNNVWFDLKSIAPARDQTLAEVHDAVAAAWTKEKTDAALQDEVDQGLAQLKSGQDFGLVVVNMGAELKTTTISRQGDKSKVFTTTVANEVFNGGPDHYGTALDGNGDHVLFHVTAVTPVATPAPATAQKYLEDGTRDTLFADFRDGITNDAGFHINQAMLSQVLSLDTPQ